MIKGCPILKVGDLCDVYSCFVHGIPPYNWEMSERQCLHAVAGVFVAKRGISGAGTLAWGSQHSEPSPAGTAKAVLSGQFTLHDLWVSGGSYEPLHNSKRVAAAGSGWTDGSAERENLFNPDRPSSLNTAITNPEQCKLETGAFSPRHLTCHVFGSLDSLNLTSSFHSLDTVLPCRML